MRRTWQKAKPKFEKRFKMNQQIVAPVVFLIDENGEMRGDMPIRQALTMATEFGFDLVEVNPTAQPPVVKIMDYGQFKYEQEKKAHKQKVQQKKMDTKIIRLSVRISKHDFDVRVEQAIKFLSKGDKLKAELVLRGRERQHPEKAMETIRGFVSEIEKQGNLRVTREQDLTNQGGRYTIILINKPD
ncbi:MAG: translation initiation factor IF-3 [bacterium]